MRTRVVPMVEIEPADWVADLAKLPGGIRLHHPDFGLVNVFVQGGELHVCVIKSEGAKFDSRMAEHDPENRRWITVTPASK